jgi:hypothetical protein
VQRVGLVWRNPAEELWHDTACTALIGCFPLMNGHSSRWSESYIPAALWLKQLFMAVATGSWLPLIHS